MATWQKKPKVPPVGCSRSGDEVSALGYVDMMTDMLNSLDSGKAPMETFYDGYVVNAIMDACYKSMQTKKWEPVELEIWRGSGRRAASNRRQRISMQDHLLIKEEMMPDGKKKLILKNKKTGDITPEIHLIESFTRLP